MTTSRGEHGQLSEVSMGVLESGDLERPKNLGIRTPLGRGTIFHIPVHEIGSIQVRVSVRS